MAERKYFGTDGIRGRVGESLINPSFVLKLGWAIGAILGAKKKAATVLIGKDTRISGYMLESALEAGLSAAGTNIRLLGPMPTPAIAYLTRTLRAEAGIVISASHNPYHDNGIKFFSNQGTKLDSLELEIEQQLEKPMITVASAELGKASRIVDAPGRYIEFCKSTVSSYVNLRGLKIVVDCAHGATYHIAPSVLRELGAEVIEMGADPDGFNINENCGSTKPEVMQKIVVAEGADVGIALDGDGDRVIMVDHKGELVDGDESLYIIVKHLLASKKFQGGVVGTEMSNLGLEQALGKLKVPFKRTRVGDRYVMLELLRSAWMLGGEPSGHIVHLGLTTTGDGIISALQVLSAMCKTEKSLAELKSDMQKYPQVLINIHTVNPDRIVDSQLVLKALQEVETKLGTKGRVLLRPSGTEPVVRVMVEGEQKEIVHELAENLADVVRRECVVA